jgi:hypothetical protein
MPHGKLKSKPKASKEEEKTVNRKRRVRVGRKQKDQVGPYPKYPKAPNPGIGIRIPPGLFSQTPATQFIPKDVRKSNANKLMIESARYTTPDEEKGIEGFAEKQKGLVEHLKQEAHAQAVGKYADWAMKKKTMMSDLETEASKFGEHGKVSLMNGVTRQLKEMGEKLKEEDAWQEQYGASTARLHRTQNQYLNDVQQAVSHHVMRASESGEAFAPLAMSIGLSGPQLLKSGDPSEWGKLPEHGPEAPMPTDAETQALLDGTFEDAPEVAGDRDALPPEPQPNMMTRILNALVPGRRNPPRELPAMMDARWNEQIKEHQARTAVGKLFHADPAKQREEAIDRVVEARPIGELDQALRDRQRYWPAGMQPEALEKMTGQAKRAMLKSIDKRRAEVGTDRSMLLANKAEQMRKNEADRRKGVFDRDALVSKELVQQQAKANGQKWKDRLDIADRVVKTASKVTKFIPGFDTVKRGILGYHDMKYLWENGDVEANQRRNAEHIHSQVQQE